MQDDQAPQNDSPQDNTQQGKEPANAPKQQSNTSAPGVAKAAKPTVHLPVEAADTDLIEKQWVEKAKEIVDHTKDNPYEQQKALGKVREDYLKKRYNKESNLADT